MSWQYFRLWTTSSYAISGYYAKSKNPRFRWFLESGAWCVPSLGDFHFFITPEKCLPRGMHPVFGFFAGSIMWASLISSGSRIIKRLPYSLPPKRSISRQLPSLFGESLSIFNLSFHMNFSSSPELSIKVREEPRPSSFMADLLSFQVQKMRLSGRPSAQIALLHNLY